MENITNPTALTEVGTSYLVVLVLVIIWSLIWKGIALWKSARLSHKPWFVVLLVINTVGILDIIYIYFIANKYRVESIAPEDVVDDSEDSDTLENDEGTEDEVKK